MTTLLVNLMFWGAVIAVIFIYVYIFQNPKKWLEVQPITITDDQLHVTIKNKCGSRVVLDKVAVAWKIGKRQFFLIQFEDKQRELNPFSDLTDSISIKPSKDQIDDLTDETFPLKTPKEIIKSFLQSQHHQVMIDLKINGKRKGSSSDYSSIRVPIINKLTQPVE